MAETHLQVNTNGDLVERATKLWPSDQTSKGNIIKGIFSRFGWSVNVRNISGCNWQVIAVSNIATLNIDLYISSIRDESRQDDEFKTQLGTTYPRENKPGWITLVLGIYVVCEENKPDQYLLAAFNISGLDLSGNPSIRGVRSGGMQNALLNGIYKTSKHIIFRPEYIYYVINNINNIFSIQNTSTPTLESLPLQQIFYGAPGTGKSHTIKREVDEKQKTNFRVTFHPDSDYSTFVGCYKPTMKENVISKNGVTSKEEQILI